jgi:hypothetical protein
VSGNKKAAFCCPRWLNPQAGQRHEKTALQAAVNHDNGHILSSAHTTCNQFFDDHSFNVHIVFHRNNQLDTWAIRSQNCGMETEKYTINMTADGLVVTHKATGAQTTITLAAFERWLTRHLRSIF